MKKQYAILPLVMMLCCLLATGCSESDCPVTTLSVARFDFRDSKTHQTVTLTNGVTISGIAYIDNEPRIDTLFNQATTYMSLPLSYTPQTTYVMHYTETLRDTIRLKHKNIPFVSDIECGAMMFYEIESLQYTNNVLDSVILVNPKINNEEKTNFNIYYRAADAE